MINSCGENLSRLHCAVILVQVILLQKQLKLWNMGRQWIIVYLLVACAHLSHQRSTPDSPTYIAAVVEYPPQSFYPYSNMTLRVNSDAYVRHIEYARRKNVDIIVFPEDGLTTVSLPEREKMEDWTTIIPSASHHYTPCRQDIIKVSETLKKISCAASDNEIYVVINIAEKVPCTDKQVSCPRDKMFYYNSNVVFDRTGMIIARYRKTNLFKEPQFNVTAVPEIVTFDTDFGVKFGTFICFDILFREPAIQLTRTHKITDIVYPTAWFSEVPFLTAVQTQAGWSFAEDVNLLASGYHRPDFGNVGSGIYLGRNGVGTAIMPSTTTHEEVLIFEVPKKERTKYNENHGHSKDQNQKVLPSYHEHVHDELQKRREKRTTVNDNIFLSHENIHPYETYSLEGNVKKSVCHNNFCCDFKVEIMKTDPNTKYRLVTFNGMRRYGDVEAYIHACGIIQCSNDSVSSCSSVQKSETIFNNIEIAATFHDYKNSFIMPSTLNSDLLPLKEWTFNDHIHDDHVHVNIFLNNHTDNLITFGIYSRDFNGANMTSFYTSNYFIMLLGYLMSRL